MKAYAILDGGGVKGAALVGALTAAEEHHIEWLGFGGTSAGSIVATLAACGYAAHELKEIVVDHPFTELLDDGTGHLALEAIQLSKDLVARIAHGLTLWSGLSIKRMLKSHGKLLTSLQGDLGIYAGDKLRQWLAQKIKAKLPSLIQERDITFAQLIAAGCKPLKIVAADVSLKRAIIYPDDTGGNSSVLDAVRASALPVHFQASDARVQALCRWRSLQQSPVIPFRP